MSAKEILQSIIENFDLAKFETFFRGKNNFLNFPNELYGFIDNNFTDGIKLAEGNLEDGNLVVYAFKSLKGLSERSSKKDQYTLGKKVLKGEEADSGIFIFYDDKGRFRFSLIYVDYSGTRREFSTFKRFTYFVSKEQTNKTFLKQIGEGDLSTIKNIKEAFSVDKVTKEFYTEIANWYFWAVRNTKFPPQAEEEENGRNIAVIRLITRMIFMWFMKERGLISREFFSLENVSELINDLSDNQSSYYKAILQNLFFATLNTKIEERKFRFQKSFQGINQDYMDHTVYRYEKYFKNKDKAFSLFKEIPFLNGGLFECLDRRVKENGRNIEIRIDGFSDKEVGLSVPNFLFFSNERYVDLNEEYGTKNKEYKVSGLLNILSSYNFTIDENVPIDQEVALDPELLGKVFENLLASYNPETATTARKATGSYYTPREIVDYMVSESLKNYFKAQLESVDSVDEKLENLFSFEETGNPFNSIETEKIISLIDDLRIVDPAVGSGAFPMGILNKLVFVLSKLDPDNELWKKTQLDGVDKSITDPVLKNKIKEQVKKQFREKNFDYGRKLYLIQKCIYGVDIQQIAVEIAKLRFFISLLVDEKIDKDKYNQGIEPLPNLNFKIMQGDSLISEFMGVDLDKDTEQDNQELFEDEINKLIKDFRDKKNEFQNESDKAKKDSLMNDINNLIINIFEKKLSGYSDKSKEIEEKYSWLPNEKQREELIEKEKQSLYEKEGFNLESAEKQLREFTEGQKTKPFFAWKLYFAEVFKEKGGFDIVISNPPYGDLLKDKEKEYVSKNYKFAKQIDISSPFVERGINLLRDKGCLTYIITYAITFNKDFSGNRYQIFNNFEESHIYSFDRDRCRFFESMSQSVSIIKCFNKNSEVKKGIFSSIMFRNTPKIDEIEVSNCDKYLLPRGISYDKPHRLPKLGGEINTKILDKLFKNVDMMRSILRNDRGEKIWIRTSGNYWYNAFDRKPYKSSEISELYVDKGCANFVITLMNSSLFYFWLRIYGDGRHMNMDILGNFPFPDKNKILGYDFLMSKSKTRFMEKLFSVFDRYGKRFLTSNIKSEIDLLDLILGRHFYGLEFEEIVHVLSYDSEIRGGNKLDRSFMNIVDKIIAVKKQNPQADTSALEREIDQLVYKLYDLTSDEISIIESNIKKEE